MKTTLEMQNVMICGCRNSIHKGLASLTGVFGVEVDPAHDRITVEHTDEVTPAQLADKLREMGYTEKKSETQENNSM